MPLAPYPQTHEFNPYPQNPFSNEIPFNITILRTYRTLTGSHHPSWPSFSCISCLFMYSTWPTPLILLGLNTKMLLVESKLMKLLIMFKFYLMSRLSLQPSSYVSVNILLPPSWQSSFFISCLQYYCLQPVWDKTVTVTILDTTPANMPLVCMRDTTVTVIQLHQDLLATSS